MKTKTIEFHPVDPLIEHTMDFPEPASKFIPEWYRTLNPKVSLEHGPTNKQRADYFNNLTIKRCMPFYDAMTSGYIITLSSDIVFVDEAQYGNRIVWPVSYPVVGGHTTDQLGHFSIPEGYSKTEVWKWNFPFVIKTPPGYSCMFTHPTFMYDTPFRTMTGIVDTDTHIVSINFPFFIKENFMGKIEKGTPICQIFPFKREAWKMEKKEFNPKIHGALDNFFSVSEKSYKNRFWHRKSYK